MFLLATFIRICAQVSPKPPDPVPLSSGVLMAYLIKRVRPIPQPIADGPGGAVVVRLVIGLDGHVESTEIISGDMRLRSAALDAARQWVYRPYLVDGSPVRVITVLTFLHGSYRPKPPAN